MEKCCEVSAKQILFFRQKQQSSAPKPHSSRYNKRGRRPKSRSSWGWYDKPAKKPIPEGTGIRGGGKYGTTWWGQQWLHAFNNISDSYRLPRGRTYANNGSVRNIRFEGNIIQAEVLGSYLYHVAISIPKFSKE